MNKVKQKIKTSVSKKERSLINASLGKASGTVTPKKQLKEIDEIKSKGHMIYIPHD